MVSQAQAQDTVIEETAGPAAARLDVDWQEHDLVCRLSGKWISRTVGGVDQSLRDLAKQAGGVPVRLDLANIESLDTAGAWLIGRFIHAQRSDGGEVDVLGASDSTLILLEEVQPIAADPTMPEKPKSDGWLVAIPSTIGHALYNMRDDVRQGLFILGATISGAQMKLGRKHTLNPAAIANQIDRMGVGAIAIIVLMSAIVGAIIAQQGAFQLRYFGAEIFVVDLVGILIWRELGVLMTAIMVSGRSGSAITAEIGSMKMREEVDALTVMGLNPVGVLVFPRLVALVIALPCLTIVANFAAVGGAMATAWLYSGIPPTAFIDRMHEAIDLSTIFAGLIKAPFMALIIGIIASVEGMKVGGSAESLGNHVTASVVKAIFVVIVVDGLFAMFYAAIDF